MQHEILAVFAQQGVHHLLILSGAQRGDTERLGLPTGEQRGPVGARQDADLGDDRADGAGVAAVDTDAGVQDGVADDVGFQVVEQTLRLVGVQALGGQRGGGGLLGSPNLLVPSLLDLLLIGFGDAGAAQRVDSSGQSKLFRGLFRQRPGFLGGVFGQLDDRVDHRLEGRMPEGHGTQHDLLGELLSLRFDHQHAFGGAGENQLKLTGLHLVLRRVQDVLAVLIADAGGGDRPEERDA